MLVRLRDSAECAYDDCSVSRCGETQFFMAPTHQRSDAHLGPTRVRCNLDLQRHKGTRPCTSHNKSSSSLPVSACGQHMTSTIYRALNLSGDRDKDPAANITNFNVSALQATPHIVGLIPNVLGHELTGCQVSKKTTTILALKSHTTESSTR